MTSKKKTPAAAGKKAIKTKAPQAAKATAAAANPAAVPAPGTTHEQQTPAPAKPPKKMSALDAAAKVLTETGQPMSCPELIAAMAAKGYWSSPDCKTPAATLDAALTRDAATKRAPARFSKVRRGQFGRNGAA